MQSASHTASEFLGRGLYSVRDAARLIGVRPATLKRWAAGYEFKARAGPRFSQPLFKRDLKDRAGFVELTFADLIEFLFVAHFLEQGVSLYAIRKAADSAAQLLKTSDHPFCLRSFKTDGKRIFAEMKLNPDELRPSDLPMLDLAARQHVFAVIVEPFLKNFDYDVQTELVNRWWPLGRSRLVLVDPAINFGAPVLKQTGVPTDVVAQFAKGRKVEDVADWYEIAPQAVLDAIEFETRHKAA